MSGIVYKLFIKKYPSAGTPDATYKGTLLNPVPSEGIPRLVKLSKSTVAIKMDMAENESGT